LIFLSAKYIYIILIDTVVCYRCTVPFTAQILDHRAFSAMRTKVTSVLSKNGGKTQPDGLIQAVEASNISQSAPMGSVKKNEKHVSLDDSV